MVTNKPSKFILHRPSVIKITKFNTFPYVLSSKPIVSQKWMLITQQIDFPRLLLRTLFLSVGITSGKTKPKKVAKSHPANILKVLVVDSSNTIIHQPKKWQHKKIKFLW